MARGGGSRIRPQGEAALREPVEVNSCREVWDARQSSPAGLTVLLLTAAMISWTVI